MISINIDLLQWILLSLRFRQCRNRDIDQSDQVIPVIHIADVEIVFGAVIRRAKDDFFQQSLPGFRYLEIEVIVADQAEQDTIAIDALVSHHLLDSDFSSTSALVLDVLYKVRIASHK